MPEYTATQDPDGRWRVSFPAGTGTATEWKATKEEAEASARQWANPSGVIEEEDDDAEER